MDRNQLIGFAMIFLLLMWWSMMRTPELPIEELPTPADTEISTETPSSTSASSPSNSIEDSNTMEKLQNQYASFALSAQGQESTHVIENQQIRLTFSNKGGKIVSAVIKNHYKFVTKENGEEVRVPVQLLNDERNQFEYILKLNNRNISTADLYFTPKVQGNKITFTASTNSGGSIEQIYELKGDTYEVGYHLNLNRLQTDIERSDDNIMLRWVNVLDAIEKNKMFEERYSTIYYKPVENGSKYCSCTGDDIDDRNLDHIQWVSHANQFFSSSLMTFDQTFDGGTFFTEMLENDTDLKVTGAELGIPYEHNSRESISMAFYIGPNEYNSLKAYDNDLEEIIPFGTSIFGDINREVIRPAFHFVAKFIASKGVVILVIIFILKMILYPLYYKMLHSQAKMGALKPELAGLKEKFKDEPQKVQMETMKVYREYGVSPLGGCLPMAIQTPIWYALFRFFPADITFRQESFLWASDLSSYDAFINLPFEIPLFGAHLSLFTMLWAVSTVAYTYYNMQHMDMSANPAMKYVQYFMPLMFLFYFNNYASGLTCYLFFGNLMNVGQTVVTKKFIFNDEKIRAELEVKKQKPKKRGKFQARLEQAMKQQQIQQKKKQKGK